MSNTSKTKPVSRLLNGTLYTRVLSVCDSFFYHANGIVPRDRKET